MNAEVSQLPAPLMAQLPIPERAKLVFKSTKSEEELKALAAASSHITAITNADGFEQVKRARISLKNERVEIERIGEAGREDAVQTSKAIIARQKVLVGLVKPEEERLKEIEDGWEDRIKAEKEARIKAEEERVEKIQFAIREIRETPGKHRFSTATEIQSAAEKLGALAINERFAEFSEAATAAKAQAGDELARLYAQAKAQEDEAERLKLERAELERQRKEQAERGAQAEAKRREDAEAERKIQEANRQRNEMAMQELQAIHHQLIIADTGRAPYCKGGDIQTLDWLLEQTEAWPITEEKFGALFEVAEKTKATVLASLRQKRVDLVAYFARVEAARAHAQQLEADRKANEAEAARIAEQRAQVERDREALTPKPSLADHPLVSAALEPEADTVCAIEVLPPVYRLEPDSIGWTIAYLDSEGVTVFVGTSWEYEDEAEEVLALMEMAYAAGRASMIPTTGATA